ncbi:hypothetical protein B9Z45_15890 [Limnohabitans sp. 2KL-17]|uniref:restriction endonuclease subunit S n=1 Tax=Limnohabitans sp. 2KL-17 TaxID=1100704 RepID=UPI000D335870|nr:restriction endonuclease subunit S [Limnohabitans sp. 2KL-17]PUE48547.1 hypothetical protein B9Z45_15890 [Limnohabitans sp. 2KL-17]
MKVYPVMEIGAFCQTGSGGTPSRSQLERYYGGVIPWVKSGELREGLITATEEHVTELALKETSVKLVPAGAVLLAMYGATVGRLAILGVEATTNQAVCHIVPDDKIAYTKYLYHALSAQVPQIVAMGVGGAQPNISQGLIKTLKVFVPPLPEQRRIAAILDQADALRAKRREALAQLDSLTQSIFMEMFGDPVANSKEWMTHKLGDLVCKLGSGSTPTGGDAAYKESGISLIRSLNVHDASFVYKNLAFIDEVQAAKLRNVVVEENDVLLNITGASVARVCRAPRDVLPARVNQHVMILRPKSDLSAIFLEHLLLCPQMKTHLLKVGGVGATREAITKADAQDLDLIVPPKSLQLEFEQRVRSVLTLKNQSEMALTELDALFASLQHRAFQGEL